MKVSRAGKKLEFAQVLAEWIHTNGHWSKSGTDAISQSDPATLLALLQDMVENRYLHESLIKFAIRYKNSVPKAEVQDVQEALRLLMVMEVQEK